ncbi:hypothetical protein [Endozoicomonas numazuensis]|uniref:Uncharacterized protein n=1 Tax=Endozoicomonas numazuensis TaxID=1137799 RepID=A0A081NF41_9GAMM|nr:hypothetical protein [Endozoicomonas numazuensis]KEQ17064.1 hypothetical protein GZ78_14320 [Endozoicomonas numazuensis]
MFKYWVIDTKVKVLPNSSLPQDGSKYYYGRSIVPDDSKDQAVFRLTSALEEDFILVEDVSSVVLYENNAWNSDKDEDYETVESFERAKTTGNIEFGCFISELSMED